LKIPSNGRTRTPIRKWQSSKKRGKGESSNLHKKKKHRMVADSRKHREKKKQGQSTGDLVRWKVRIYLKKKRRSRIYRPPQNQAGEKGSVSTCSIRSGKGVRLCKKKCCGLKKKGELEKKATTPRICRGSKGGREAEARMSSALRLRKKDREHRERIRPKEGLRGGEKLGRETH